MTRCDHLTPEEPRALEQDIQRAGAYQPGTIHGFQGIGILSLADQSRR